MLILTNLLSNMLAHFLYFTNVFMFFFDVICSFKKFHQIRVFRKNNSFDCQILHFFDIILINGLIFFCLTTIIHLIFLQTHKKVFSEQLYMPFKVCSFISIFVSFPRLIIHFSAKFTQLMPRLL